MSQHNIGEEILQGLQEIKAWRQGKVELKTTEINMPSAKDVPIIRNRLGLSQRAFAAFMGVSVATLRNWEQGRREPHGSAKSLLLIADKVPDAFEKAFNLAREPQHAR
jgi:putative transcriptional regulator